MRTIANIATFAGREKYLERTLGSIVGQFDEVNIWDNETAPRDMTDRGKFAFLDKYKGEAVYYFTLDDDIIYPPDYVARTVLQMTQAPASILTYHGRVLLGEGRNYYRGHQAYHCTKENTEYKRIHVPGTGVMCFRTDAINPRAILKAKDERMVDLLFAKEAAKAHVPIVLGIKPAGWIVVQPVPLNETIYGQEVMRCERQGLLADEVYRLLTSDLNPA